MAEIKIAEELISWMQARNWGNHHLEYHLTKRYDRWNELASQGNRTARDVMNFIREKGWSRTEKQEGEDGDGLHFLAMHRAMINVLKEHFPQQSTLFIGWKTPPTNPDDENDPVPDRSNFDPHKLLGIGLIENDASFFESEDHFGLFIQTNLRPIAGNPLNTRSDQRYGLHNYLHNRWTVPSSPINLGDPEVNFFNKRFWDLHGWIDIVWTNYRKQNGKSDDDREYKELIDYYKHMMMGHHHKISAKANIQKPEALKAFFSDSI